MYEVASVVAGDATVAVVIGKAAVSLPLALPLTEGSAAELDGDVVGSSTTADSTDVVDVANVVAPVAAAVVADDPPSPSSASSKIPSCAPALKPLRALYAGVPYLRCLSLSYPVLSPSSWLKTIICFAPCTHLPSSSAQYTGGWALASFFPPEAVVLLLLAEGLPVTVQRYGCMYMFGCPQPSGTQSQAQVQPSGGQVAGREEGTAYVARRCQGVLLRSFSIGWDIDETVSS
jgi:hypothetical protein